MVFDLRVKRWEQLSKREAPESIALLHTVWAAKELIRHAFMKLTPLAFRALKEGVNIREGLHLNAGSVYLPVGRAYLLQQLALSDWDLGVCAKLFRATRPDFIRRLEKAGFGYLFKPHVLQEAMRLARSRSRRS